MNARLHRKRPDRKPKPTSALPRRPRCRECRVRAPSGACLNPVPRSGRCGDYIRCVRGNTQYRRLYTRPTDPRTLKQKRWRARFGDASREYRQSLTDEQQDACIAVGVKLRGRPCLGRSGSLTGQQHSIRGDYSANPVARKLKTKPTAKVLQSRRLTPKYRFFAVSSGLRIPGHPTGPPSAQGFMMISPPPARERTVSRRLEHKSFSYKPLES